MRFRLLIITLISFICTAFINVADKIYVGDNESELCIQSIPENYSYELSDEDFDILNPAESCYSCHNSCARNFSKRKSDQRQSERYTFFTCGKSYNVTVQSNYQLTLKQNSNSLLVPFRSYISLGILRI